jgi:hypothetical protein
MINALITKRNNPNVMMVIGSVSMINIGLSMALKTASTNANINAVVNWLMWMPDNIYDNPNATTAETIMRTIKFIKAFVPKVRKN